MLAFISFNDGTRIAKVYPDKSYFEAQHGIKVTDAMLAGMTTYTVIYGQEVEIGFTNVDEFAINPDGSIEYEYRDGDGNDIVVTIFKNED